MKGLSWVWVAALFVCGCGQSGAQGGLAVVTPAQDAGAVVASDAATTVGDTATTVGVDAGPSVAVQGPPVFKLVATKEAKMGKMWCMPVFDGERLVVSTEGDGGIQAARYDLDLNKLGDHKEVAGVKDTYDGSTIADHKHIYQNKMHYITFSIAGGGQGGYLYLMSLDHNLERVGIVTVVAGKPPTNDMMMVGDGKDVYVGKFRPGHGHDVYRFDADLKLKTSVTIGGGAHRHANGASAVYVDGIFHLTAPSTLAPGKGKGVYHIAFDGDWKPIGPRELVIDEPGTINLFTGLSHDPVTGSFITHYTRSVSGHSGTLQRTVFGSDWKTQSDGKVFEDKAGRPHSALVGDSLFLGYEGSNHKPTLARYDRVKGG